MQISPERDARRTYSKRIAQTICLLACLFQLLQPAFGDKKAHVYKHDAKGLEKQFGSFLKVVTYGSADQLKSSFAIFALPNPDVWFGQYFPKDQVQQLVWDNDAELDAYRNALTMLLRRFLGSPGYWVRCKSKIDASTTLKPRADAIQPIAPVPIEQYTVTFTGSTGHSMSELANFVYVDGAFRYLGKGAYPFWSMPNAQVRY